MSLLAESQRVEVIEVVTVIMVSGKVFSGSHAVHPITFEMRASIADVDCVTSRNGLMGLAIGLVSVIHGAGTDKVLQLGSRRLKPSCQRGK